MFCGRCSGKREFIAIEIAIDLIALMRAGSAKRAGRTGRVANAGADVYQTLTVPPLERPQNLYSKARIRAGLSTSMVWIEQSSKPRAFIQGATRESRWS